MNKLCFNPREEEKGLSDFLICPSFVLIHLQSDVLSSWEASMIMMKWDEKSIWKKWVLNPFPSLFVWSVTCEWNESMTEMFESAKKKVTEWDGCLSLTFTIERKEETVDFFFKWVSLSRVRIWWRNNDESKALEMNLIMLPSLYKSDASLS